MKGRHGITYATGENFMGPVATFTPQKRMLATGPTASCAGAGYGAGAGADFALFAKTPTSLASTIREILDHRLRSFAWRQHPQLFWLRRPFSIDTHHSRC